MKYFEDNSLSIGNRPLVQIRKIAGKNGLVLGKVEGRNPSYSVKCRIGASMVWDAEKRGVLKPGMEIIEPTSGNTGIALAYVGAARGYKVTLTMPSASRASHGTPYPSSAQAEMRRWHSVLARPVKML